MADEILTLLFLVLLQAVLGFDNLLYISIESQRAPKEKQARVRSIGIILAIFLRIALLFLLTSLIKYVSEPFFHIPKNAFIEGHFNLHSVIVLLGGGFVIYTAIKEIWHMLRIEEHSIGETKTKSVGSVIMWIVIMNLVFSFDSILSAIALTDVFWVQAAAIVIGGIMMIALSGKITVFLQKNRMYEVLGLFILFVVGIMLVSEGGHLAHLKFFEEYPIMPLTKTTFYFVIFFLVVTDIVQSRYQKILDAKKARKANSDHTAGH